MAFIRNLSFGRIAAVVTALVVGTISTAKADIVIDDFTVPAPATAYSLAAAVPSTFSLVNGNRTVLITQTQNIFGGAGATSGFIGTTPVGGRFVMSTATGATANALLTYDYAAPLNLAGGGTILNFSFTSTDLNVPFSVTVKSGASSSTQVGLVSSPTNLSFDLAGFTGVDLAAVTSIELALNRNVNTGATTESADFSIANVTITTPNNAIPAPPAVLLALAAIPVLGLRRKMLAKKA